MADLAFIMHPTSMTPGESYTVRVTAEFSTETASCWCTLVEGIRDGYVTEALVEPVQVVGGDNEIVFTAPEIESPIYLLFWCEEGEILLYPDISVEWTDGRTWESRYDPAIKASFWDWDFWDRDEPWGWRSTTIGDASVDRTGDVYWNMVIMTVASGEGGTPCAAISTIGSSMVEGESYIFRCFSITGENYGYMNVYPRDGSFLDDYASEEGTQQLPYYDTSELPITPTSDYPWVAVFVRGTYEFLDPFGVSLDYNSHEGVLIEKASGSTFPLRDPLCPNDFEWEIEPTGSVRWEILEVIHPDPPDPSHWFALLSIVDTNDPPAATPIIGETIELRGQTEEAGGTYFEYAPEQYEEPPEGNAIIGPTTKTAYFEGPGPLELSDVLWAIRDNQGYYNDFYDGDVSQALNTHIQAREVAGQPGQLALTIRSKQRPYIKISDRFPIVTGDISEYIPDPLIILQNSTHAMFGFRIGEFDTTNVLTPSELAGWINAQGNGLHAEVVVTEIYHSNSWHMDGNVGADEGWIKEDSVADFSTMVQVGDQIDLTATSPSDSGIFQITMIDGNTLLVNHAPFATVDLNMKGRIFREQVKISTTRKDSGGSIEMVSGPEELGFPLGVQRGSLTTFEALDKFGNAWDFGKVSPGDFLRIVGSSEETVIAEVRKTQLILETGLPSTTQDVGFEIQSGGSKQYTQLQDQLTTYSESPVLLKNHHFDENLDELDAALTSAILPGQNFASNRNRAKQVLADLLSILTETPKRSSEYVVEVPVAALNLDSILSEFISGSVPAIDSLITTFLDRKYDRAVDLLRSAHINGFYDTTEETGSYAGAVIDASRTVVNDLPKSPSTAYDVETQMNVASKYQEVPDAEKQFDDTEE